MIKNNNSPQFNQPSHHHTKFSFTYKKKKCFKTNYPTYFQWIIVVNFLWKALRHFFHKQTTEPTRKKKVEKAKSSQDTPSKSRYIKSARLCEISRGHVGGKKGFDGVHYVIGFGPDFPAFFRPTAVPWARAINKRAKWIFECALCVSVLTLYSSSRLRRPDKAPRWALGNGC